MKHRLTLLIVAMALVGCQYDPFANRYTTRQPDATNVAGRYELAMQTVTAQGLAALAGRQCFVELRDDGTFTAANIPPWVIDAPAPNFFSTLASGSGTWRIDKVGSLDTGWGKLTPIWGVHLDSKQVKFMPVHLTGKKPPHGLLFGIGDPDAGQALILEKAQ
jgi:hypothetical protein